MGRFLNWKSIGSIILIGLIVWFMASRTGFSTRGTAATADAEENDVITVFRGDLAASATASGQIAARQRVTLSVSGNQNVSEVMVRVGEEVDEGQVLLRLDTVDLELNVANAVENVRLKEANLAALLDSPNEYGVVAAEADLASAQASYDELLSGPTAEEIIISEAGVDQANASIYSSSATLNNTLTSVSEADLEMSKAAVIAAQVQLEQAQDINNSFANQQTDDALRTATENYTEAVAKYNRLLAGADSNSVNASQSDLAAAVSRRDQSQAELDQLLLGPTATELATAEYNLVQAELALSDLLTPASVAQITIAEAELAQAQLDLEAAQTALAEAYIVAPFAGLVTGVHVAPGEIASGPLIELADMTTLELVLGVDEADLAVISAEQQANITLESWPSLPLASEVRAISPSAAEDGSGITSYDVHLTLGSTDLPIKIGMTADAQLITEQRTDVLLIPNAAIEADRQTGEYFVNLIDGESITKVEITIGLRDDNHTQLLSGVIEGDQLVIDYQVPLREGGPGDR